MTFGELKGLLYLQASEEYGIPPEELDKLKIQYIDLSGYNLEDPKAELILTLIGNPPKSIAISV